MNSVLFSNRMDHKRNGFTFIEIMVVIVILGVLSAVGVPKILGLVEKTKEKTDLMKLYYLRDALNKALLENADALSNTTLAKKNATAKEKQDVIDKMNRVLATDAGATLFVIEVHNGLSVNVQNSHGDANNANNISAILGTSGTWCDALREAGFEGVADIVTDRITGNYKKNTSTYTSFQWHDDVKNKDWQRTAPRKPMFTSLALNKGKENANTRYTMNARWSNPKNPGHSLEIYLLPNGKKWNSAFRTDYGVCFSTYGQAGCANSD